MAVLVGFVPTPEGRAAVRWAGDECRMRGSRLVIVNSPRPDVAHRSDGGPDLPALIAELAGLGVEYEVRDIPAGPDPAEDLLAIADEVAARLIVIGLRRRTPVGKLILGSNAQRILLDARCPVLAVKADTAS